MTVEIDSILQHEEIQGLLESAEATGTVRQPEVADLIEAHQLDVLEVDALFNELERRGIELSEEPERDKEKGAPRSRSSSRTRPRPTRYSCSCGRPAAMRCSPPPRRSSSQRGSSEATCPPRPT
jgi:hypothetical protein